MGNKKYTIENVGTGTELSKRFTLKNTVIEKECKCGNILKYNLDGDYLSYPRVGSPQTVYMYCDNCMEDYEAVMKVTVLINLEVEEL